jgi:Uma2 family endonuclease
MGYIKQVVARQEALSRATRGGMVTTSMRMPPVQTRRFSRVEYDQLIQHGFFEEDEPIELLDGLLVVKEPQGSWHVRMVSHIRGVLQRAFGDRYDVLVQSPLALDDASEPEPDLAVVRELPRAHLDSLPSRPLLVVEVAESSLRHDRLRKGSLYARAGVRDYWIVNLVDRALEVYREPTRGPGRRWRYRSVRLLRRGAVVSPLAAPRARIRVANLLP